MQDHAMLKRTLALAMAGALSAGGAALAQAPAAKPAPATERANNQAELDFWSAVKDTKNPDELKAYLETYPTGSFAALAKVRLKALEGGGTAATPATGAAPVTTAGLGVEKLKEVQVRLHAMNYPITKFDGDMSAELVEAIRRWQTNSKFQPTGQITEAELIVLRSQKPPTLWGAIAFTAKETFTITHKPSRMDAETTVMDQCKAADGKDCKALALPLNTCAAAAGFRERVGSGIVSSMNVQRANNLSLAQIQALAMCGRQPASQGRCEILAKVCGDGSHVNTTPQPKAAPKKDGKET